MDKKANKSFLSEIAIPIMVIFLPVFYLIGYFYESGYLSAYGVSSEYFPRDVPDYLTNSFGVIFRGVCDFWLWLCDNPLFYIWVGLIALCYIFTLVVVTYIIKNTKCSIEKINGMVDGFKRTRLFWFVVIPLSSPFFVVAAIIFIVSLLIVLMLAPLAFYFYGINCAHLEMNDFKYCPSSGDIDVVGASVNADGYQYLKKCVYIFNNEDILVSGFLITASPTHVAVWDGRKSVILDMSGKRVEILKIDNRKL